ncbi:hypothetical protein D3C85_1599760 [compost metagenome]
MLCSFLSESAALMLLALISRVIKAMVRLSCRLLSLTGSANGVSGGITRVSAAIPSRWVPTMPAAISRLAPYFIS